MKKIILLFLFGVSVCSTNAQSDQEKQQLKNIILTAYESVSQSTRQWLADAVEKHPPGEFDTAYAKVMLKEKFSMTQLTPTADLWVCMLAYQKMVNKEAREDRKIQSHTKRLMLASKAEKLKIQNEAIDKGMQEAREKADIAMQAATTSLVIAIASGLVQIGAAATAFSKKEIPKDTVKIKNQIRQVSPKLSVTDYIKKLERQLEIVKKMGN